MDYSYYPNSQTLPSSLYGLHGLPTPGQAQTPRGDLHDAFSLNNYSNAFEPNLGFGFVPPPHSPPDSFSKHSTSSNEPGAFPVDVDCNADDLRAPEQLPGRSSSEEKDGIMASTPVGESRRKEQNRAAQRAFRERGKQHVRDLEEKVSTLQHTSSSLQADNERLKQELARYTAETEVLRATAESFRSHPPLHSPHLQQQQQQQQSQPLEPETTGPMKFTPKDFFSNLVPEGEPVHRHRLTVCETTGEKLLDAGETWDFLQAHELVKKGAVDIAAVCERLKGHVQCSGQGPAFTEGSVKRSIEECVVGGKDELI